MSETPRTDAAPIHTKDIYVRGCNGIPLNQQWVHVDFARQLERELNALKAQQMTEEKAREVLGKRKLHIEDDNGFADVYDKVSYPHDGCYWDRLNVIGEQFTSDELRAIAWWMDNKGGER